MGAEGEGCLLNPFWETLGRGSPADPRTGSSSRSSLTLYPGSGPDFDREILPQHSLRSRRGEPSVLGGDSNKEIHSKHGTGGRWAEGRVGKG